MKLKSNNYYYSTVCTNLLCASLERWLVFERLRTDTLVLLFLNTSTGAVCVYSRSPDVAISFADNNLSATRASRLLLPIIIYYSKHYVSGIFRACLAVLA